jgi:hypothetical protein
VDIPRPPVSSSPGEHPDVPGQRTADPAEAGQPFDAEAGPAVTAAQATRPPPGARETRKLFYITLPGWLSPRHIDRHRVSIEEFLVRMLVANLRYER